MRTNKIIKVVIAVVFCLALVATACAAPAKPVAETEKTIKVGALLTLTGPIASWIGPGAPGIQDWFAYVTEQGGMEYKDPTTGKTEKVKVELMWGDHAWDIARTISLYERFKAAGMQFVICHGSVPTTGIMGLAAKDKIAGMASNCTFDPTMYQMPDPYITASTDAMPEFAGRTFGYIQKEYWKESRPPNFGIICLDAASRKPFDKPEGVKRYVEQVLKAGYLGVEYISMSPVDVSIELKRMKDKGADWLYLDNAGAALRVVLENADRLGMKSNTKFFVESTPEYIIAAAPQTFEGCLIDISTAYWNEKDVPGIKLCQEFMAKYHPGADPATKFGHWYLYGVGDGMTATQIIKTSLEKTGYAGLTGTVLRDTARNLKDVDTMGLMPKFSVDPQFPLLHPVSKQGLIRGGKIENVSGFWEAPPVLYKPRWNPTMGTDVIKGY